MRNLLTIGLLFGLSTGIMAQGVFISEYIEGSSFNKALEIYNGGEAAVDLADYSFWRISNGGPWDEYTFDLADYAEDIADMTLDPGETFVVCNSSAMPEIQALSDLVGSGIANHNGDDALGLAVTDDGGTSWTLIDAVGEDGADPGTGWDVAGVTNATKDHTLVRKNSVVEGNIDWALSAGTTIEDSEWIVLDQNVYENLGSHGDVITVPPTIADLMHAPELPTSGDPVLVSATVTDDTGLVSVILSYSVDAGAATTVAMTIDVGDSYIGTIPAQADGSSVEYFVEATDDDLEVTTSATNSYNVVDSWDCTDLALVRANDVDGVPLMYGDPVFACGTVTVAHEFGSAGPAFITGPTGSVAVYSGALYGATLAIGDEVEVIGEVGAYMGLTQVVNSTSIVVTATPGPLAPIATTIADLNLAPESFEAQLVTLLGVTLVDPGQWPAPGDNGTVDITQAGETIAMRVDRDTNIDESAAPSGEFDLTGVIGQYDTEIPYDVGYQVIPRSTSDITGGGGNLLPVIADMLHAPELPTPSDPVLVSATVTDDTGLDAVILSYSVDAGAATTVAMTLDVGDSYIGTIPAQIDGSSVEYFIEATDDDLAVATSATASYSVAHAWECTDLALVRANDVDGISLMDGQPVMACGTVTAAHEFGSAGPAYMTGPTGSIAVYGGALYGATLAIGDEIQVLGEVGYYNGLTQVVNSTVLTLVASPGPLTPLALTVADVNLVPESYEAQFVTFTGVELVDPNQWPAPGSNADVDIVQGTDAFSMRIDRDTDIDEGAAPVGLFNLTGVIGQYDTDGVPFDSGYQILPRMITDLVAGAGDLDAPVVSIEFDGSNVVLTWDAVVGATDYMVHISGEGYDGFGVGTSTGGLTTYTLPAVGVAFFHVSAVN